MVPHGTFYSILINDYSMKILFVESSIAIEGGGASRMIVWVANQFAKDGHQVAIYTHKVENGPLYPIDSKIKVYHTDPLNNNCFLYPIPHVRKLFKEIHPDIVISFMTDSNLYCILAKIGLGIPVCICERNDPALHEEQPLKFKIALWMSRFADCASFQLQAAADYYSWLKCPKSVIPNPVPQPKAMVTKPFAERKNEICCSSRLEFHQKRQDVLIKAFAIVLKSHPEMTLRLIGDGPHMDDAKKLAEELGVADKVFIPGQMKDPITYMVNSKVYVLSSDFEGIPNALSEALAGGLPCVSTDVSPGGARFLMEDKKSGLIVPCNAPEKMAEAIVYLLDHPKEADEMGREATKISEKFSEERIYMMWKTFIEDFLYKKNK